MKSSVNTVGSYDRGATNGVYNEHGVVRVGTINETARFFGVPPYRLRSDIKSGKLKCIVCGRKYLLNYAVVQEYLMGEYLQTTQAAVSNATSTYQPNVSTKGKKIPAIF